MDITTPPHKKCPLCDSQISAKAKICPVCNQKLGFEGLLYKTSFYIAATLSVLSLLTIAASMLKSDDADIIGRVLNADDYGVNIAISNRGNGDAFIWSATVYYEEFISEKCNGDLEDIKTSSKSLNVKRTVVEKGKAYVFEWKSLSTTEANKVFEAFDARTNLEYEDFLSLMEDSERACKVEIIYSNVDGKIINKNVPFSCFKLSPCGE